MAGEETDLVTSVVVDDSEALLLDVPNDGGPRGGREGEAVGIGAVDGEEVVGSW